MTRHAWLLDLITVTASPSMLIAHGCPVAVTVTQCSPKTMSCRLTRWAFYSTLTDHVFLLDRIHQGSRQPSQAEPSRDMTCASLVWAATLLEGKKGQKQKRVHKRTCASG